MVLELGLRKGELCGLKWADDDFEKALEHARIALGRAPAGPQMQNLETQIARLEEGENINP